MDEREEEMYQLQTRINEEILKWIDFGVRVSEGEGRNKVEQLLEAASNVDALSKLKASLKTLK